MSTARVNASIPIQVAPMTVPNLNAGPMTMGDYEDAVHVLRKKITDLQKQLERSQETVKLTYTELHEAEKTIEEKDQALVEFRELQFILKRATAHLECPLCLSSVGRLALLIFSYRGRGG